MPEPTSAAPTPRDSGDPPPPARRAQQPAVWTAGARLHFGLLDTVAPCGGAGMMVDEPKTQLRIEPADRFQALGPAADRVTAVAERFARHTGLARLPACRLHVLQRPLPHSGLGTGTQLALAVAAALNAWTECGLAPQSLARDIAGRGGRSMIGSNGFFDGGLLTDPPLPRPLAVDPRWRVLLVRPAQGPQAVCGDEETTRFARLPAATSDAKQRLAQLLFQRMVPAAAAGDFDSFAESVYQYNHGSGMLFAAVQGGPYHGAAVTAVIDRLRRLGLRGVGQSSWGPTVFAFCHSPAQAQRVAAQLAGLPVQIVRPQNQGARCSH